MRWKLLDEGVTFHLLFYFDFFLMPKKAEQLLVSHSPVSPEKSPLSWAAERGPQGDLDAPQAQKRSRLCLCPRSLSCLVLGYRGAHTCSHFLPFACPFDHVLSHCGRLLGLPECQVLAFPATSVSLPSSPVCSGSEKSPWKDS